MEYFKVYYTLEAFFSQDIQSNTIGILKKWKKKLYFVFIYPTIAQWSVTNLRSSVYSISWTFIWPSHVYIDSQDLFLGCDKVKDRKFNLSICFLILKKKSNFKHVLKFLYFSWKQVIGILVSFIKKMLSFDVFLQNRIFKKICCRAFLPKFFL